MDKYRRLLSNTVIFAIGTFSSKVLSFALMPFLTRVLTTSQLSVGDLAAQTANLLIPLASLGIVNAIIRFGLDKAVNKSDVLSTGLIVILAGYLLLLPFAPLISMVALISDYTLYIYLFVLTSALRSLFSQFVRVRGLVRLYALDGIFSTVLTILFNVLFLLTFQLGVAGYVLATICADVCSAIFLFFVAGLRKFIKFQNISRKTAVGMLKYSIPLIPNMICWWVTNSSDKYVVAAMLGTGEGGLLTAAYKLPTLINLISTIFLDAWQMSAVVEEKNREEFFSKVFRSLSAVVFMAASGMILCTRLIMQFFVGESFYPAWKYVPFLVMATSFSCLVTFLGSVYTVEKKSVSSMVTMITGAVVNLGLNLLLVPILGVNGAALGTLAAYLLVFILRAVNTKKYIKIKLNTPKLVLNTLILAAQSVVLISEPLYWVWYELGLCALMLLLNAKEILLNLKKLLSRH